MAVRRVTKEALCFVAAVSLVGCSGRQSGSSTGTSGAETSAGSSSGGTSAAAATGASTGATSGTGTTSSGGMAGCLGGENSNCFFDGGVGFCCDGRCVDALTSQDDCGSCRVACLFGETCQSGVCALPDGGIPATCDGAVCPTDTVCVLSQGYPTCLSQTCGPTDDGSNCSVDGGFGGPFGELCCQGACIDLSSDPQSCGVCGATCPGGGSCVDGSCSTPADAGDEQTVFECTGVTCPEDTLCVAGIGCVPTTCAPGRTGQYGCAMNRDGGSFPIIEWCCGDVCSDLSSDSNNCGECGNVCPAGSFCKDGACPVTDCSTASSGTECVLGTSGVGTCCLDTCVDTGSNPTSCGGCGEICPTGGSCMQGVCAAADGGGSFFDCRKNPTACPPGTACGQTVCAITACAGVADGTTCTRAASLSGECCGGACIDPVSDPLNCGGCGIGAQTPNGICLGGDLFPPPPSRTCLEMACPAGQDCLDGYCILGACQFVESACVRDDGGLGLCCPPVPGSVGLPVCDAVLESAQNCGDCGLACPVGQACVQGLCAGTLPPCAGGNVSDYCNLDAGLSYLCCPGGGCIDTATDAQNCGSCGTICDGGCLAGVCQ